MKNICVVITNRAHWGRLKSVLNHISLSTKLNLQLIVGGSALLDKYGECVKDIENHYQIIDKVYCVQEGDKPSNMADTTAMLIMKLTTIFERIKPDIVLVHADRYEQLAVAIAASYMNIKVAHTQGGEVTGSIDDKVRNAITQLADIHFPSTEFANSYIYGMRNDMPRHVYTVGCPSLDIIPKDLSIKESFNLKYGGVGCAIDYSKHYNVVMFHPVTTESSMEKQTEELIRAVVEIGLQTVWFWPNVDAGHSDIDGLLRRYRESGDLKHVRFVKNMSPEDFYRLIANCNVLLGNTSSGIREGSFLGVRYICVGDRQNNREWHSNTIRCVCNKDNIIACYNAIKGTNSKSTLYGNGTAGKQIADILEEI